MPALNDLFKLRDSFKESKGFFFLFLLTQQLFVNSLKIPSDFSEAFYVNQPCDAVPSVHKFLNFS